MIIFIEILSTEATIRFSTQVNGKTKEKGGRDKRGKEGREKRQRKSGCHRRN